MASYHLSSMEQFNFTKPEEWPQWIRRFERFRQASGVSSKSEQSQVNILIYSMGLKADDIFQSFGLSDEDGKKYQTVKDKFNVYFTARRNTIHERAKFNRRRQGETESVDEFITDLYALAKYCDYGGLHDELIRDRIVVGIRDANLSEKMQMEPELTLERAVTLARQSECVKTQLPIVRGEPSGESSIEAVKGNKLQSKSQKFPQRQVNPRFQRVNTCGRCGRLGSHIQAQCPARDAVCRKCGKIGHYKSVCRSTSVKSNIRAVETEDSNFLGTIHSSDVLAVETNRWTKTLKLNQREILFKIDTGADVTVIPDKYYSRAQDGPLQPVQRILTGAGHQPLEVQGQIVGLLQYNNLQTEQTIFVIKGLSKPLLGRPAIEALALVSMVEPIMTLNSVVNKFPQLFQGLGKLKDNYCIKLHNDCQPYALTTPRRVAIPLLPKVEAELQRMLQMGVIEKVDEPTEWCSGMVVVPKPNGSVRICVDLTKLNKSVQRERHILPSVEQTLAQIGGAKVFSKLDANSGFWQVELSHDSSRLTTFLTPFGRFCFKRLPFGITSAPEYFQRRMSEILSGLRGVVCLIDDVLVYGATQEDHDKNLLAALSQIQEAGLTLNKEKCVFSTTMTKFLGQMVDANGIKPDPDKIKAINDMPCPTNITELRRFLGMVNQLNKFSPNLASHLKPLHELLSSRNQWRWDGAQENSFLKVKAALTSSETLCAFNPSLDTIVSADASSYGVGAVLRQKQPEDQMLRPVAYISRVLSDTEKNYAQIEKEALAVTWACERFQNYLLGLHFQIETDHKPLVPLLSAKPLDQLPIRVQRFRLRMMRFDYVITHVPGKNLQIADALSRSPVSSATTADSELQKDVSAYVDLLMQSLPATDHQLQVIKDAQNSDATCSQIKSYCQHGWPDRLKLQGILKNYLPVKDELSITNGLLLRGYRLVIPQSLRSEMLQKLHAGHQGISKCRQRASQSVWWPAIGKDIEETINRCMVCCKAQYQHAEPLMSSDFPDYPWQRVASDLFEWKKSKYLLVIDYYSRYIEIARLSTATSSDVINHMKSIFARHGVPESILSDNGPQYASAVFTSFAKEYGFTHITSSPRYPQGNGAAERAVRTVKGLLEKNDDPYLALMSYRSTPLENGYSPAELLMGRKMRTIIPMIPEQLLPNVPPKSVVKEKEMKIRDRQQTNLNNRHNASPLKSLNSGDLVYIPDNDREGTVLKESSTRSYIVQTPDGHFRRNRRSLIPLPSTCNYQESSATVSKNLQEDVTRTKSGRISKPPDRLDL